MKNKSVKNKIATIILGATLAACPIQVVLNPILVAEAHSGRTDSNGGHHDYKNKSGLGSYHYHCGGYPAHLHENGVCPYANAAADSTVSSVVVQSEQQINVPETAYTYGWQKDATGWWYGGSDGGYLADGMYEIGDHCFLFDKNGYMQTGWHEIEDEWSYFDGNGYMVYGWKEINGVWYYFDSFGCMLTGVQDIDDEWYYFGEDGAWDGNYYDDDFNVIAR